MSHRCLLLFVAFLISACATSTRQTDRLVRSSQDLKKEHYLNVPFVEQAQYLCGPAAMTMVMQHTGNFTPLNLLTEQMYTKELKGTFQTEMMSAARRQGFLPLPVRNLHDLLKEVSNGHPVIVFQNLGLKSFPKWHYAVVTGYNLAVPEIILHSGKEKNQKMDMRLFERTWVYADSWALTVETPDDLPSTATELDVAREAVMFESLGKTKLARDIYLSMLKKWPRSYIAHIGLGNTSYALKDYSSSMGYLERASRIFPDKPEIWHNLAFAADKNHKVALARRSSAKAVSLAGAKEKDFRSSLSKWLTESP